MAQLARMSGKTPSNVRTALRNGGMRPTRGGRYNTAQAIDLLAMGLQSDKAKQEQIIADMERRGVDPSNIIYQSKRAQIRRIILHGDLLEIERDKARGSLVDVRQAADLVKRRDDELTSRLITLRDSEIAKHPEN